MSSNRGEPDRLCICSSCRVQDPRGMMVNARRWRRHNTSRVDTDGYLEARPPGPLLTPAGHSAQQPASPVAPTAHASPVSLTSPTRREDEAVSPSVVDEEEVALAAAMAEGRRRQIVPDDPSAPPENDDVLPPPSRIPAFQLSQDFVNAVAEATISNGDITGENLRRLLKPPCAIEELDPDALLAIELFAATSTASEAVYESTRQAIQRRFPGDAEIASHASVQGLVERLSGVVPIQHDMCINSCIAYTGPFALLETCPECKTSRYDLIRLAASDGRVKVAQQTFSTMPIGPQIQALYRHPDSARAMAYRSQKTEQLRKQADANGVIQVDKYDDLFCGKEYLEALGIEGDDTVLIFSVDGAQLYRSKQSDTWIGIWVNANLPPNMRYSKDAVEPAFVIPGPRKPKIIESFLLPTLRHLAAIQKHGLPVWNGAKRRLTIDRPYVLLVTADGPAMQDLNGNNGHLATCGCRRFCPLKGRHKPQGSQYYPAMASAEDYPGCGKHGSLCNAHEYDVENLPSFDQRTYDERLAYVGASRNPTEFAARRQETGINKPSIFSGLPRILSVPRCCPGDLMHHAALNLPDLFLGLWRATLECDTDRGDAISQWTWAVLRGDLWKAHGKTVADATPYLPGFFDRAPRNPAEKINSGYKAIKYIGYFYVLGPALLHDILPRPYYRHFCMLVRAHRLCMTFVRDYEILYYGRRTARIHFVRQSIHSLTHLAREVLLFGPPGLYSQWTMERTIGNLGQEIRQPSNPYANLSQRAVRRGQLNAVMTFVPSLAPAVLPSGALVRSAYDLGHGFSLRPARDATPTDMPALHVLALRNYVNKVTNQHSSPYSAQPTRIMRWARLSLPSGLIARSAWKEDLKPHGSGKRIARNVMVQSQGYGTQYVAEVLYYFVHQIAGREVGLAMVHRYSAPDKALLEVSHGTLVVCDLDKCSVEVIAVKNIKSVVGMVPLPAFGQLSQYPSSSRLPYLPQPEQATRFFVAEKLGLDIMQLGGSDAPEEQD